MHYKGRVTQVEQTHRKGNKSRADTMRYKNHQKRDYSAGNHNWVAVMPDFEQWPNQPKTQKLTGVMLTCTKCWRLTQAKKETYRPCKGSQAQPSVQQADFWRKLTKFPENMQLFLNVWHTTKQEADKKFERLPQQGIETNPGPFQSQAQPATATTGTQRNGQHNSSSSNEQEDSNEDDDDDSAHIQHKDQCRVLSANTGGAPGIWKLIKQVIPGSYPEIICIQEAALSSNEYKAIHKQLHSLGYSTYYSKGQHLRKVTGGVLTAIRREIPHSLQYKHEEDAFQHLLIEVGEWMLLNTYIPPRPGLLGQALATTTAIFEACVINSGDRPWLWLGDLNSDVNQLNSTAETQGGKLHYSQSTYKHHKKLTTYGPTRQHIAARAA